MILTATHYPEEPYPGSRPAWSFVIDRDNCVLRVCADLLAPSGWALEQAGTCLDGWLASHNVARLAERVPVLSYGSNPCPAKLVRLALSRPIVSLACTLADHAAVWASGRRQPDGSRVATIASRPGHRELHFVTFVEAGDLEELDSVEGHPGWYRRQPLPSRHVVLVNGRTVPGLLTYVGQSPHRIPDYNAAGAHLLVFAEARDGKVPA